MPQTRLEENGSHTVLELTISKVGKLGIEFRSTSSPYFVINVSNEAQELYGVQPGDLLLAVKKDIDPDWTSAEGLLWANLVEVLKHRPSLARFKRFNLSSSTNSKDSASPLAEAPAPKADPIAPVMISVPPPVEPVRSVSPVATQSASSHEPIKNPFGKMNVSPKSPIVPEPKPVVAPVVDRSPTSLLTPRRRSLSEHQLEITVIFAEEGPLGLEFEDMDFPFRVGGVRANSLSSEKGIHKGDSLVSVNGKDTKNLSWEMIRTELSRRPATVVFRRDTSSGSGQSIWDVATGFIRSSTPPDNMDELRRERDELKEIVSTIGGEDLGALRQMAHEYEGMKHALKEVESQLLSLRTERESASSLLDEERTKNAKLVEVIDEIEKSQSQVIDRFEKELQERDRQITQLREAQEAAPLGTHASPDVLGTVDSLKEVLKQTEAKLELMEKDNTRLRKESTELGVMVQQCLEKIKRDLSDKPHWVDRRVVCSAIGTLLRDLEAIDERSETAADAHLSARQKLGDVLGLTYEERASVGLLSIPNRFLQHEAEKFPSRSASIGEDFVSFLEREATNLKS